jgi:hypothetical protein
VGACIGVEQMTLASVLPRMSRNTLQKGLWRVRRDVRSLQTTLRRTRSIATGRHPSTTPPHRSSDSSDSLRNGGLVSQRQVVVAFFLRPMLSSRDFGLTNHRRADLTVRPNGTWRRGGAGSTLFSPHLTAGWCGRGFCPRVSRATLFVEVASLSYRAAPEQGAERRENRAMKPI